MKLLDIGPLMVNPQTFEPTRTLTIKVPLMIVQDSYTDPSVAAKVGEMILEWMKAK